MTSLLSGPSHQENRLQRLHAQAIGAECSALYGGDEGDRTPDLLSARQALSQLSYIPTNRGDTAAPSLLGEGNYTERRPFSQPSLAVPDRGEE